MGGIVDCQANSDDNLDDHDRVEGQVPVPNQGNEEEIDQKDGHHDQQGDRQTTCDKDHDEEDCND